MTRHVLDPLTGDVLLRDVTENDLLIFFAHQLNPTANHTTAFTTEDPADQDAILRHWAKIIGNEAIKKRTTLFRT